jgi:pimeloyl-ACP methyl ester carboxylesterase
LRLTVHSLPAVDASARRTATGRLKMMLVLAVCAMPVLGSYLTYYVIKPGGRTNYSELIEPQRAMPPDLPLTDMQGAAVLPASLQGQWLLVVVSGGTCDATCERMLWLQRQVREALGREKTRVDKLWLIHDAAVPPAATLQAVRSGDPATVLRVPPAALAAWLAASAGSPLESQIYVVDPMGHWMMRSPPDPDPGKFKRDLDRLLRASASWDKAGR